MLSSKFSSSLTLPRMLRSFACYLLLDNGSAPAIRSCAGFGFCRFALELHFIRFLVNVGVHFVSGLYFTIEKLQGQRILDQALNCPFHRTRAKGRIVAFAEKKGLGSRWKMQMNLALTQAFQQMLHLQVDDVLDLVLAERPEQYDIVNSV